MTWFSFELDPKRGKQLRAYCLARGVSITDGVGQIVNSALNNWEDDEYRKELQRKRDEMIAQEGSEDG